MTTQKNALNLDSQQQKNFLSFLSGLEEKQSTTVRIFDRGDYYSVHGDDADLAAKVVFKSTTVIKVMDPDKDKSTAMKYVSLNKNNFETFIKDLLLVRNYRVEVYVNKNSKGNDWRVEFKGSPGNLLQFEDLLFSNNEVVSGNALLSVYMQVLDNQKNMGVACIDTNENILSVTEFVDNDFYNELEAILVLLSPRECIIPSTEGEYRRIKEILERNSILVTPRKKNEFEKSDQLIQDLNKIVRFKKGQKADINTIPEISQKLAMCALQAALKYSELANHDTNLNQFTIKNLVLNRFVHLDAAAIRALNLFPPPNTDISSNAYKWQSVLGVLDKCKTTQGRRLLSQWIKQPLRSLDMIKDRHDIVECLFKNIDSRNALYNDHLNQLPDILVLIKKLSRKKASLQDVFKIYQVILRLPGTLNCLSKLNNVAVNNVILNPMKDIYQDLINYKSMVEETVDMDEVEKGDFLIRASFDEKLQELKEKLDSIESKMDRELRKAIDDLGVDMKLEYVSHIGYHFRMTLKEESSLRKQSKYKIIDTARGGVRFTCEALTNLNTKFSETKELYEDQQKDIVEEIVGVAAGYIGPLTNLNFNLAQLDCLLSFAEVAGTAPGEYVRPHMYPDTERILDVKMLRHPCLEFQEDISFIPNDVHLKQDETLMYVLFGPNMGGKSSFVRSVGVAVLLAHIGSFVPCKEAHISVMDSILGRIGADDNIMKGLSTFMVEMVETAAIIRTATEKSLVIIDELGRGTSTFEGCGIAWSIAEHLAGKTKCFTLFATHFHEIAELAKNSPMVKNYHMAAIAENDKLTLLYQVRPGVIDNSFGIQVAEIANIPEKVLEDARHFLKENEGTQHKSEKTENDKIVHEFLESIKTIGDRVEGQQIEEIRKRLTVE